MSKGVRVRDTLATVTVHGSRFVGGTSLGSLAALTSSEMGRSAMTPSFPTTLVSATSGCCSTTIPRTPLVQCGVMMGVSSIHRKDRAWNKPRFRTEHPSNQPFPYLSFEFLNKNHKFITSKIARAILCFFILNILDGQLLMA